MSPIRTARPAPTTRWGCLLDRLASQSLGGTILLAAAVVALVLANSPLAGGYTALRDTHLGIPALGLDLSIGHWAADGVLAIFFVVVGMELKREFVTGSLRDPRAAALPIAAAVGGMLVPAGVYALVVVLAGVNALRGVAIPVATDIAFALGLVAVAGRGLPSAFRVFLLTLAIVDDLLGILVIAIGYTDGVDLVWLVVSLVAVAAAWFVMHRGIGAWWILVPLGLVAWYGMYRSGVHATISGVLLGLCVPAKPIGRDEVSMAEHMERGWTVVSQAIALPVFAFFAAGVPLTAGGSFTATVSDPVFVAVALALVVGKPLGIVTAVALLRRLPVFRLDPGLRFGDVVALSAVAGIGFTVSLLLGELAFRDDPAHLEVAHLGVIAGSLVSAVIGIVLLRLRSTRHAIEQRAAREGGDTHDEER